MSLFKKKKEEVTSSACCCANEACETPTEATEAAACCDENGASTHFVKVLGSGCASCHALYENTCKAVKDAGLNVEVEYVTDMEKIMSYGVMSMPALVVNDQVVSKGRVLKVPEIAKLLEQLDKKIGGFLVNAV